MVVEREEKIKFIQYYILGFERYLRILISKIYKGVSTDITMQNQIKAPARYPRLDTILMIEEFIKENDGEYKKKQLWERLPKKMMYQTYSIAIDYLLISGKISVDAEGKIGWIFYPKEAEERMKKAHLFWKNPNGKTL